MTMNENRRRALVATLSVATLVDSGVAESVRKQEAGWSYLRSGL